jgi:hypothetical protein
MIDKIKATNPITSLGVFSAGKPAVTSPFLELEECALLDLKGRRNI